MQKTGQKPMLDDKILMLFEGNLRRIFAMKISRSTFRELQNVILNCTNQNQELANFLFETLLTGQIKGQIPNEKHREILEECIKTFTIPSRLAKEVYERGEFINIITSDLVTQGDECAFLNRIRRIDGEEFSFLSDPANTINLLRHFAARLPELEKNSKAKEELHKFKNELSLLGERLKQMAL
ncbi:MAG: CT_584 family protein [Chlamydiales bacterium]